MRSGAQSLNLDVKDILQLACVAIARKVAKTWGPSCINITRVDPSRNEIRPYVYIALQTVPSLISPVYMRG